MVAAPRQHGELGGGCRVEGRIVESPTGGARATPPRGPNAVHRNAPDRLAGQQRRARIVIDLPTRDDVDLSAAPAKIECEVGEQLARCRMIRVKIAIDQDQLRQAKQPLSRREESACEQAGNARYETDGDPRSPEPRSDAVYATASPRSRAERPIEW